MVNKIVQSSQLIVDRKEKNLRTIKYLLYILVLTLNCQLSTVNRLYGYSLLGVNNYGDMVTGFSARSIGMGSTDITAANDSAALASNPAALLNTTARKMVLSVTPGYNVFEERRNEDGVYSEYTKMKLNDLGAASYLHFGGSDYLNRLIVGIQFHPIMDMAYKYSNKYSNKTNPGVTTLRKEESINSSGGINELDLGLGVEIIKEIYAGFTYGILSGENPVKISRTYYNNNVPTLNYTDDRTKKYDGNCLRYGLILTKWDYLLGMFYQPAASITTKTSGNKFYYIPSALSVPISIEEKSNLPEKFGFGFSYRFKDKYRTLFAADYVQQNWNTFTSTSTVENGHPTGNKKQHPPGYERTQEIKVGFQHWLNDWIPVRYGFRLQQFYQTWDNNVYNFYHGSYVIKTEKPAFYCISFGSGYVLGYFDIDLGYEFGKRSYETDSERFDEYLQKFALTARWRW